ncbi:acyltransferase [Trichococcus flocculiformis]|uniref:acyltransferase n=1 Tax=Trichococcus flocculiformis TaxID=82803 RepID=UPI002AAACF67|nr:DapH/DapD/GlmU-related protein [Trichococcus flocculiformis]
MIANFYHVFSNNWRTLFNPNLHIANNVRIKKSIIKKNGKVILQSGCRLGPYAIISPSNGNIIVGEGTSINAFSMLYGPGNIIIGNNVSIAPRCSLMAFNHNFLDVDKPIKTQGVNFKGIEIGDDVWIGNGVTVLDGVKIARGCVIGAGSVVTKSIPEYSIAFGNPCKVVRSRTNVADLK